MTWVILCGLDRTGKSTVAKYYETLGYEIIHFSAPDKKFSKPGYSGPSYCDTIVELLVSKSGKDVVFDRSWYGESIWSAVYRRLPLLNDEDLELLREFEEQNSTTRILMHDPDKDAHWQRCVDNKEPLDGSQFLSARAMYYEMGKKYGFELKTIKDFEDESQSLEKNTHDVIDINDVERFSSGSRSSPSHDKPSIKVKADREVSILLTPEQLKLAQANAINEVLSKRIVKSKGEAFDSIESKIRSFLNQELGTLLGNQSKTPEPKLPFSKDEVDFLKALVTRAKEKK